MNETDLDPLHEDGRKTPDLPELNCMVDINTKMIALFGRPLGFSFAARLQNAAYRAMGLNMLYFYCEIGNEHLPDALNAIRYMNFAGCAVTKPNKVFIMKYLDEADELCAKMGACNTVVKTADGALRGYNTDGMGGYHALTEAGVKPEDSVFISFGAGGCGRALCSTLAYYGTKKIYVTDISEEAARSLVSDVNERIAGCAEFVPIDDVPDAVRGADVVMNNTGLGMTGMEDRTPVDASLLRAGQLCFDATYNPEETRFLREAKAAGCRTLNGSVMNIMQAAAQIKLWSGRDAPMDCLRDEFDAIIKELRSGA